jgi:hypothetical protein
VQAGKYSPWRNTLLYCALRTCTQVEFGVNIENHFDKLLTIFLS